MEELFCDKGAFSKELQFPEVWITVDPERKKHFVKPDGPAVGRVQNTVNKPVRLPINEICAGLCNGEAIRAAACTGNNDSTFQSQQLFLVDIDNGEKGEDHVFHPVQRDQIIDKDKALEIARAAGLEPSFIYPTFNNLKYTGQDAQGEYQVPKIRVAFVLGTAVTNVNDRTKIQKYLMQLYGDPDQSTVRPSNLFFGSQCGKPLCADYAAVVPVAEIVDRIRTADAQKSEHTAPADCGCSLDDYKKEVEDFISRQGWTVEEIKEITGRNDGDKGMQYFLAEGDPMCPGYKENDRSYFLAAFDNGIYYRTYHGHILAQYPGNKKDGTEDGPGWYDLVEKYEPDYYKEHPKKKEKKEDQVKRTRQGCIEIILKDPRLRSIAYNELAQSVYARSETSEKPWTDYDDALLRTYLEKYATFKKEIVEDALLVAAKTREYNPIKEKIEATVWDGVDRISTLLPDYLGAEKSHYNTEIMKIVLLGALCRLYQPGVKYDYVAVFTGGQGIGKSTFCRRLALDDHYFSDAPVSLNSDKPAESLRGAWIVELSELLSVKRATMRESVKSFITSTRDRYRAAYGRNYEEHPRRCIMLGTTNSMDFLSDKTGERRWLPVTCGVEPATKSLFGTEYQEDFLQAYAQAKQIYDNAGGKVSLLIPEDILEQLAAEQEKYKAEDPEENAVLDWLFENKSKSKDKDSSWTTVSQVYAYCSYYPGTTTCSPAKPMDRYTAHRIDEILRLSAGWIKDQKKSRTPYGITYAYRMPENWLEDFRKDVARDVARDVAGVSEPENIGNNFVKIPENIENPFD